MSDNSVEREPFHWQSAISYKVLDRIIVRGYDVNELAGNISFAEHLYLVWKGELPPSNYAKMLDALLVIFAEHAFSPSSVSARMVMSGAGYIMPAMAGGILAIGYTHVDAHEAADAWIKCINYMNEKGWDYKQVADWFCRNVRKKNEDEKENDFLRLFGARRVLPGWHHPQHIKDPRGPRLVELAEDTGIAGDHVRLVTAIEETTPKYWGRKLFMNVAGIIAACLVDMGFEPEECLAFCAVARSVSVVAHAIEEKNREKGWRASSRAKIVQPLDLSLQKPEYYDGPMERKLPEDKVKFPLKRHPYGYVEGAEKI